MRVIHIALDYHPHDSRIGIKSEDVCQTLTQRMGTGGGNVPLVLEIYNEDLLNEQTGLPRTMGGGTGSGTGSFGLQGSPDTVHHRRERERERAAYVA